MRTEKVICTIQVLEEGAIVITNQNGETLKELTPMMLAESLQGREIKKATVLPQITVLESNPSWVCIGGRWYYIP